MNDLPHGQERKTCMPCRKRKVKCDGRSPKCGPCSLAKRELDCTFPIRPENRDKRNALPKGKACLSCRSKKKKCDGSRPICNTCSRSRDPQPCTYDEVNNDSRGNSDTEGDSPVSPPCLLPALPRPGQYGPTQSALRLHIPSSSDSEPQRSITPSVLSSPPSPKPLPLLRMDERQMDYFRSLAFSNALRLGICFSHIKERFIREGDLSGRAVNPWFTWFMTVMGVHIHQEIRHEWEQLSIQRTITQTLLKMASDMKDTVPSIDLLQVFYLMAMSCTYTYTLVPARRYLARCQELIKTWDFRLVEPTWIDASARESLSYRDTNNQPPEYTDKKHELVSVLVNLMYLQCMHCLCDDECHGMFADVEAQLPEFEAAYKEVFNLSPIVLRARTILLVRDVALHIKLLEKRRISQKEWLDQAKCFMDRLNDILGVLESAVNQLHDSGRMSPGERYEHRQTYLLLSSCRLFCMTAQAQIYMATSQLPILRPGQKPQFRGLVVESMQAFLLIYRTFDQEDDLRYLDYYVIPCLYYILKFYRELCPNFEWFPITEVNKQIIALEGTLRVSPAGRGMSIVHSLVRLDSGSPISDEPDFLREDERLKHGL